MVEEALSLERNAASWRSSDSNFVGLTELRNKTISLDVSLVNDRTFSSGK